MTSLRDSVPKILPSNPGTSVAGSVAFSNPERSWREYYDLTHQLASVLRARGYRVEIKESWLEHAESGYILLPRFVQLQTFEKKGVRTATTIQVHHPLLVPAGVFEYQHSTGQNLQDSFRTGFEQWAETDLVPLMEALEAKPATCTVLKMNFPEKDGKAAYERRAILGPALHFAMKPQVYSEPEEPHTEIRTGATRCEDHPFCPCCLITRSFETFKELIEMDGFYGLRLFAARAPDGFPQADCRVNGEDWQRGAEALRNYVKTWPDAGYEFRKQYVVLHTVDSSA